MAKKSNKTEHVLKLITQEEHEQEEIIEEENPEQGPQEVAQDELEHYHEHRLLINLAEIMVKENFEAVMDRMNICECDICKNDVMAIALNSLPTRYVTTDKGKQFIQLETYKKQYEVDVMAALTKACVKVKVVPRH
ncbi:MAG: late competence development ComFB family protein [Eubacteriales bacterium]|nr:late competence development ComFB family protein [Eubacteriales bacterium]MDD4390109.1 late competence development ComFB family protein [Eubacteriales bacterium]